MGRAARCRHELGVQVAPNVRHKPSTVRVDPAGGQASCQIDNSRIDDRQDLELEVPGCLGCEIGLFLRKSRSLWFPVFVNPEQHNGGRRGWICLSMRCLLGHSWSPGIEKAPDLGACGFAASALEIVCLRRWDDFGVLLRSSQNKLQCQYITTSSSSQAQA